MDMADMLDVGSLRTWVLTDGKAGHENQSLGVADALGIQPDIIRLHPGPLNGKLAFLGAPWAVSVLPSAPYPDLLIATGNLTVPVVRYIKQKSPHTFAVQMMRPQGPLGYFDVIAAPLHDGLRPSGRVITTLGAPNRITPEHLAANGTKWSQLLNVMPGKGLAVLVGGTSKQTRFGVAEAQALAQVITEKAAQLGLVPMVTTSRRTGAEATAALRAALPGVLIWSPDDPQGLENPYQGFLALAGAILVTVDSTSMVSEACSTGVPVYVFGLGQASKMGKFSRFYKILQQQGYVFPPEAQATQPHNPLAEATMVAGFVRASLARMRGAA